MDPTHHRPLTERQLEIIDCISDGLTNPEIAKRLYIGENTVKVHVRRIFARLGCNTRAQVAALAAKNQVTAATRGDDLVLRAIVRDAVHVGQPDRTAQARLRRTLTQPDYEWMLAASRIIERLRVLDMMCTPDDGRKMYEFLRTLKEVPDPEGTREAAAVG